MRSSSGGARFRRTCVVPRWAVVSGARRSRSAQAVAVERAVLTDLGALDDPFAERMLDPAMAGILWGVRHVVPGALRRRSVTLAGLAARVRWHDDQVRAAMDDGIDQVVVVGAGYDSRAWRLARSRVRWLELDHPATQADKAARAPAGGPTFVPADLRQDGAVEALVAGGLSLDRPSIYVLEGLTMYLPEPAVRRLLRDLASVARGSRLSTDFYPPSGVGTGANRRQDRLQRLARGGSGEDLRLQIGLDDALDLVASEGWTVTDAQPTRDVARRLVPPATGLPIDAINPAKTLLAARR